MNLNRFLNDLAHAAGIGGAEKRFARELGRTLGLRIPEPEHGIGPKVQPIPVPAPEPDDPAAFAAGQDDGKRWGFEKAFRSDLDRIGRWVAGTGGMFTAAEAAAVVFPNAGGYSKADAEKLAGSGEQYARGFLAGVVEVWKYQLERDDEK